jgi:hypothetical protein
MVYTLLLAAELTDLVLWTSQDAPKTKAAIPAAAISVAVVLALSCLSFLEYPRSTRSSDGINVFLFLSVIFDAVMARTLWLLPNAYKLALCTTICTALKLLLLALEAQGKTRFLFPQYKHLAPEELSGVFSRRLFWWLNEILLRGYKTVLLPSQLYCNRLDSKSNNLLSNLERNTNKGTYPARGF